MTVNIKNLRNEKPKEPWDFVVDRTSVLGNPYYMSGGKTRKYVCEEYKKWFVEKTLENPIVMTPRYYKVKNFLEDILDAHKEYGQINLFCWCTPKQCHAETIKEYLDRKITEDERKTNPR